MFGLLRTLSIVQLAAATLALSGVARAWEADVHYGLTKWLALQAGYTADEAEWVAQGNQGIDDSLPRNPLFGTLLAACGPFKDAVTSAGVRQDHFASRKGPPNSPNARTVEAGLVFWDSGERHSPKDVSDPDSLSALGRYLHALQDSWSHQGPPDTPWFCHSHYAWGHAEERGGWLCHVADHTYRWHDTDVLPMARRTYEVLRGARRYANAKNWSALEPKVKTFAQQQSKRAKDAWFKVENFSNRDFLLTTSLPDCDPQDRPCIPMHYEPQLERWQRMRGVAQAARPADMPDDFRTLYARFFESLVEQRDATLRFELMSPPAVAASYAQGSRVKEKCPDLYPRLHKLMLGPGFLDGSGAQQPRPMCERVASFGKTKRAEISCPDALQDADKAIREAQIRGSGLDNVVPGLPRAEKYFYTIAPGPAAQTYVAFGRFIHLPRDILAVGAGRVDNRAMITSVFWVPNE